MSKTATGANIATPRVATATTTGVHPRKLKFHVEPKRPSTPSPVTTRVLPNLQEVTPS